ncbi:MAG: Acyl-phosphate:glycerol-3-phosphate O-acyltransferase PlsY [uncultured Thiotrichaceae bacterium]|uniref:Glycerol-3-phosphate acyltransferase n=1 Tax=uncultured Thiotrichaceae bacterium TaxID=298394 RepID=A0A6S6S8E3_9GAMM|nr:MAG: Acyl-phosphate:glycerol-3-phosphate O-acyltransferase PlsY [uncultured Thiotrichaceae bacterium]
MHPEATSMLPYLMIIAAYLLGSVSTAILTCKMMGLTDPRTAGSNNPGATNVLRVGGKKAAAITLIGDMLKGLLPVLLGKLLGFDLSWLAFIGLAAFLGHLYPLYFGFKGGKGVATAIGVYAGLNLWAGLLVCATWLFVAKVLKISSLAALVATLLAPLYFYLLAQHTLVTVVIAIITVLIYWRHRSNIQNMLDGKESKIKS